MVEPRFIADTMLGRLARWLRFLGYDTTYPDVMEDTDLLALARREGRVLLTRDKGLAGRTKEGECVLLVHEDTRGQLLQIIDQLGIGKVSALSRCSVCNCALRKIVQNELGDNVPEGVRGRYDEFWVCDGCGRHYWKGSHYNVIKAEIDGL